MSITIRPAAAADLSAIQELWKEFMDFHQARDPFFTRLPEAHQDFGLFMKRNLNKDDWLVLVAVDGHRVVGYGSAAEMSYPPIYQNPRYGYIQDVAVTHGYRGQGIGRQLFERMAAWFKERGISRMELEVAVTNELSQAFWQKMGFQPFTQKLTLNV